MVAYIRAILSHIAVAGQVPPSFLEPSLLHGFLPPWNSHSSKNLCHKNYNVTEHCHCVTVMVLFVCINITMRL